MQIEWKSLNGSPYIFKQFAEWPGIRIHRASVMPGRMHEHTNPFHDVNVSLSGKLQTERISATGRRVSSLGSKNNFCITPAGQQISARWNEPIDNMGISLAEDFVSTFALENGLAQKIEFIEVYEQKDPLVQNIGLSLLKNAETDNPAGQLYSDSLINTLVFHLLTNYTTAAFSQPAVTGGLSGYKLRLVTEFINEHLDKDLGLNEIAAVAELSPFHFSRAFRRSTGKTPQQYLMQQRVEHAKELLARPELPLVEVGLRSGFKNQSHFTTLFRKYTRLTPRNWRDAWLA